MIKKLEKLFEEANEKQNVERKESSKRTSGTLRGAMAGAILPAKGVSIAAKCGRLDQARILGVERGVSYGDRVMFSAGFGHELFLEAQFRKIAETDSTFTFDREVAIKADFEGTPWHGTPDFMLNFNGEKLGIEAKSLVSNFSVGKQLKHDWPFRRHILQAAHYMTILGHERWIIAIGHYFYALADGANHKPSIRFYEVCSSKDAVHFKVNSSKGETLQLDFGPEDIKAYLRMLLKSNEEKKMMPKPKWVEFGGIKSYNECSYCPMQNSCNEYDNNLLSFDEWMDRLPKVKK